MLREGGNVIKCVLSVEMMVEGAEVRELLVKVVIPNNMECRK